MHRRFSLVLAVAAIFAFAMPQIANAAKITSSAGVLAPVGTKISALNVGTISFTSSLLGTISCAILSFNGTIEANNGTMWETKGNGEFVWSDCTNNSNKGTLQKFEVTKIFSSAPEGGPFTGTMNFVARIILPSVTCTFTGTNTPFTYQKGGSHLTFTKAGGIKVEPAACGAVTLDATWTLEIGTNDVILD